MITMYKAINAPVNQTPGAEQSNKLHYKSKRQFMNKLVHSIGHVDGSGVLSKQLVSSVRVQRQVQVLALQIML